MFLIMMRPGYSTTERPRVAMTTYMLGFALRLYPYHDEQSSVTKTEEKRAERVESRERNAKSQPFFLISPNVLVGDVKFDPDVEVAQISTRDPGAGIFLDCLVPFYVENNSSRGLGFTGLTKSHESETKNTSLPPSTNSLVAAQVVINGSLLITHFGHSTGYGSIAQDAASARY
ncbi:hypothetical protein BGX38DRAFT_1142339 [Terfezia claveryi]|nr:hypothetical protein BGX38DRAFT_1142339 [Terfezia claveryi]